jgi:hypothetical protein
MKCLACAIACAAWMGMGTVASAKTRVAGVALSVDRELDAEAVAAGIALQRLLATDSQREPLDLGGLALGEAHSLKAKKGDEHLARALDLLDQMKEKAALEDATEAMEAFEDADLARDFAKLLDSIAVRALALYSGGSKEAMRAELVKLYALKADYELDSDRANPDVLPMVVEARAEVGRAPRAMLEVISDPVPAEVFVDGIYRGIGAVSVPDLAPGRHFATLRALGYELAQQAVLAGPGQPGPVRLTLKPAANERGLLEVMDRLRKSSPPGGDESAAALAKWANAEEALVVVLRRKGKDTWAQAVLAAANGNLMAAAEGRLEKPEGVVELAKAVLGGAGAPVVSARPRRTLAYALGGAAIAALGAGVVLGVTAKSDFEKAKGLQFDPDRTAFERTKTAAAWESALANIGYGLGAAAAGVGLYFAITGDTPKRVKETQVIAAPVRGGGAVVLAGRF